MWAFLYSFCTGIPQRYRGFSSKPSRQSRWRVLPSPNTAKRNKTRYASVPSTRSPLEPVQSARTSRCCHLGMSPGPSQSSGGGAQCILSSATVRAVTTRDPAKGLDLVAPSPKLSSWGNGCWEPGLLVLQ